MHEAAELDFQTPAIAYHMPEGHDDCAMCLCNNFRLTNLKLVSELAMGISVPVHPDAAFTRPAGPDLVIKALAPFWLSEISHNCHR